MKFKTETGSVYEVDFWNKKFRRLSGEGSPTPRLGADGGWKDYHSISIPVVGEPTTVFWNNNGKATMTSRLTEVVEETPKDKSFFKMVANKMVLGLESC